MYNILKNILLEKLLCFNIREVYKKEGGYAAAESNVVDWTVKLTGISGLSFSRIQLSGIQKFGSTGKNKCIRTYISTRVMCTCTVVQGMDTQTSRLGFVTLSF